jgi:glycosyltransferase involved in cell wall biosynthesis
MTRMLEDGEERQRLADAGRARVAEFTWERTAAATLAAYRRAAADGARTIGDRPRDDGVAS